MALYIVICAMEKYPCDLTSIVKSLICMLLFVSSFSFPFQCYGTDKTRDASEEYLGSNNGVFGADDSDTQNKDDQSDMTFCMSNYAKETMKMIFMMRSHHMLTDVVLEVQQELFHAHKVILSAASPYFKAMFTGGLKECEMSRVKLQGVIGIF